MEEKIEELEERIKILERKDKRRRIFSIIKSIIIVLLVGALIYGGYRLYIKIDETIKPYKEIIDKKDSINNNIQNIKDLFE